MRKSMICMMKSLRVGHTAFEKQHDQPEGAFTERNMNRLQQSWVKTAMQYVMDEKGQNLLDNLAWFAKKLYTVMTSASACEHMWSIEGWIHKKRRNRSICSCATSRTIQMMTMILTPALRVKSKTDE